MARLILCGGNPIVQNASFLSYSCVFPVSLKGTVSAASQPHNLNAALAAEIRFSTLTEEPI
jgi:hypothetical protein